MDICPSTNAFLLSGDEWFTNGFSDWRKVTILVASMDVLVELSTRAVALLAIPHEVAGVAAPLVVVLSNKLLLINVK